MIRVSPIPHTTRRCPFVVAGPEVSPQNNPGISPSRQNTDHSSATSQDQSSEVEKFQKSISVLYRYIDALVRLVDQLIAYRKREVAWRTMICDRESSRLGRAPDEYET